MTLSAATIQTIAQHLDTCQRQTQATSKVTDEHPGMDWNDAYSVQEGIRHLRLARGERLLGLKAGLTSHAKMQQMGVSSPIFGFLTDSHALQDGATCNCKDLIHPKVEPEIAFVMRTPLRGPGCHLGAVLTACDFVMPALEVIDSRYQDFKFDLKSVIADNTSAARFVVGGQPLLLDGIDLRTIGVVLERNGSVVAVGAGAAVLGHPAASVAMLANHLATRGEEIPAGCVILTGAITEAISVSAFDTVQLKVQGMGCVGVRFL